MELNFNIKKYSISFCVWLKEFKEVYLYVNSKSIFYFRNYRYFGSPIGWSVCRWHRRPNKYPSISAKEFYQKMGWRDMAKAAYPRDEDFRAKIVQGGLRA